MGGSGDVERVRVVFFGCLLALGLSFCPSVAYASDGFFGGLEDLTGTRQVEQEQNAYEERYQEDYEPELREVETAPSRELSEDATTVDYINDTVDKFNQFNRGSTTVTLFSGIRWFLFGTAGANMAALMLLPAAGIVFMWWGVRKSKNMIMNAFRKGKASL